MGKRNWEEGTEEQNGVTGHCALSLIPLYPACFQCCSKTLLRLLGFSQSSAGYRTQISGFKPQPLHLYTVLTLAKSTLSRDVTPIPELL